MILCVFLNFARVLGYESGMHLLLDIRVLVHVPKIYHTWLARYFLGNNIGIGRILIATIPVLGLISGGRGVTNISLQNDFLRLVIHLGIGCISRGRVSNYPSSRGICSDQCWFFALSWIREDIVEVNGRIWISFFRQKDIVWHQVTIGLFFQFFDEF